ncbi:MAG: DUF131 domain-containing protein [Acidilobus sp.]|jgi:uncharacterized protein (TIGR00304 family)
MAGIGLWITVGITLILIGMAVIIAATLLSALGQQPSQQKVEAGGVIMIGPIPIIFGTSWRMAIIAIVLAIVLIAVALVMMLLVGRAVAVPQAG